MMSKAVVALAMLESVTAFQAPVARARTVQMFSEGDIGVLPPLGVYDPLGLIETKNMARYEVMEIKHGRAAMLGFLHVISVEAGALLWSRREDAWTERSARVKARRPADRPACPPQ